VARRVVVVTGLNLPTLLDYLHNRDEYGALALADRLMRRGRRASGCQRAAAMSWILHRVDDRLIHGQVVIAWGQRLHPQRIWVADDLAAANPWERDLLARRAPGSRYAWSRSPRWRAAYAADERRSRRRVSGDPRSAHRAAAGRIGAGVSEFTLGGLHYAPGKAKVNEYIYLDEADRARRGPCSAAACARSAGRARRAPAVAGRARSPSAAA
jgi:mannose/fructose/N-acetylgalactosamine-specific phosphotransferase system component IIB